ncbi:MAG: hypothetical protein GY874_05705 [Desulfobacteraceae bacterium]|nr:hypothetical protein [Desulfobacteraceae bacterium]
MAERIALKVIKKKATEPFNLTAVPLFRTYIIQFDKNKYFFFIIFHHLIFDGSSDSVFHRDLADYYNDELKKTVRTENMVTQFGDYVRELHNLDSSFLRENKDYWENQLRNPPSTLMFPSETGETFGKSFVGAKETYTLSLKLCKKNGSIAKEKKLMVFVVLLGAYKILLSRLTGQQDIIIGSPIVNRKFTGAEDIIGPLFSTLPLRSKLVWMKYLSQFVRKIDRKSFFPLLYTFLCVSTASHLRCLTEKN